MDLILRVLEFLHNHPAQPWGCVIVTGKYLELNMPMEFPRADWAQVLNFPRVLLEHPQCAMRREGPLRSNRLRTSREHNYTPTLAPAYNIQACILESCMHVRRPMNHIVVRAYRAVRTRVYAAWVRPWVRHNDPIRIQL